MIDAEPVILSFILLAFVVGALLGHVVGHIHGQSRARAELLNAMLDDSPIDDRGDLELREQLREVGE